MTHIDLVQKIICLAHRTNRVRVAFAPVHSVSVLSAPGDLRVIGVPQHDDDGWYLDIAAGSRRTGYVPLVLTAEQDGASITMDVPTRIFADKECFFCLTTTTNFHWGFAPDRMQVADAMAEIERNAGTQFDPRVVDAFCDLAVREPRLLAS